MKKLTKEEKKKLTKNLWRDVQADKGICFTCMKQLGETFGSRQLLISLLQMVYDSLTEKTTELKTESFNKLFKFTLWLDENLGVVYPTKEETQDESGKIFD